ncbi:hypothetical protein THRCLA_10508 [Thraustotheca clavata]|uniref:Aspartyl/asparaginy/proline hydroxylase domain-containing protein n=1 Tax=Thraustotheca clavata TaxID=74557 RepID=A0A1V9YMH9_9STRA|nr:hypothetical protein THRCLA_10508 [Thraustotheca clavata]
MQNAPLPPSGVVPLSHKRRPTEVLVVKNPDLELINATTRATGVDIAELKREMLALTDERWSEEYQSKHNVSLRRPFHDKVGVNKIICIFSDNHLENVYMLPEWDNWKRLVEPIFERIGVPVHRVVRCLFARLPAKVVIPPHHDNGPWVGRSHRIHLPIVTFPEVEFKSGPLESSMTRYAFNEGTIIELNNAAKHSVYNGGDSYRIHMIFDVIEEIHVPKPVFITLKAGQRCRQIRGRVELISESDEADNFKGAKVASVMLSDLQDKITAMTSAEISQIFATACRHFFIEQINALEFAIALKKSCPKELAPEVIKMLGLLDRVMAIDAVRALLTLDFGSGPNYAILGVQKCGTTSLYRYLGQHPSIINGKRREPHFFDWFWDSASKTAVPAEVLEQSFNVLLPYPELNGDESITEDGLSYSTKDMRAKYLISLQAPLEKWQPKMLFAESTPSYLLYGAPVAKRFKKLFPNTKFIVMMRDPVQRAYSQYQMTADAVGTSRQLEMRSAAAGKSFEDVVAEDLALLKVFTYLIVILINHTIKDVIANPTCPDTFQDYASALPKTHGAHSYVGRGLYALQLQVWFQLFPRDQFLLLNIDAMNSHEKTQNVVNQAFSFLGLPPHQLEDSTPQNTRAYQAMQEPVRKQLEAFYAPFNAHLRSLAPSFDFCW